MGVKLSGIVEAKTISLEDLKDRVIAIDAYNMLYQFLATIRGPDGSSLTTSSGRISSHLVGLFARCANFLEKGMKPVFVFDGEAPKMKTEEQQRRREAKLKAKEKYETAKEEQDVAAMKKYASRLSRLTPEMVDESKKLCELLGIPVVQAPSEGEAQAAHMVRTGQVWASASEDYDSLLFGSPRHVRQLTVTGRRRKAGKIGSYVVQPEIIEINKVLNQLDLTQDQLIALGILTGTDFNPGGVKGIGPKKSLKLLEEHGEDFETIFAEAEYEDHCDVPWKRIMEFFRNPPTTEVELEFGVVQEDALIEYLVGEFEFGESRVRDFLERVRSRPRNQTSLGSFT